MKITRTAHAPAVLAAALAITLAAPSATAHADTGWSERPAPFALGTSGLNTIAAAAPDAVWVGGYQWRLSYTSYPCPGVYCATHVHQNPVLQSGNGSSWSWIGTPGMPGSGQILEVDAVSAADAWAAGRRDRPDGSGCGTAYVAHDGGNGWSELPAPDGLACLEDIDGDAAGAWVAGRADTAHDRVSVYRWSGQGWEPHDPGSTRIADIEARAHDDVWAVGTDSEYGDEAFAAHYDGSTWRDMTPPRLTGEGSALEAVLARAADDVWVTGRGRDGGGPAEARSYHWNGTAWREVPVPEADRFSLGGPLVEDGAGGLYTIAAPRSTADEVGLLRYSGGAWVREPVAAGPGGRLLDLAHVPGTRTVMAVGVRDGKPLVLAKD
ncbi:hypothetical protein [Actinomadura sp. WAC 06369]|uniref:hypothetical protein n=1 Tax=Actinomadura sp. WAC 06369 TaxID=2203193 RepID=UPI000F7A3E21|nr:hypothetical protein [Actinomadura sp. WAC 06369]RSN50901.1 hypothetical protein DMH08_31790 [Actinomadura sp. WAC 06369]